MTKIIEKTVESKYAPHDTNVSWLDVSGDKPVKKYYINGKWVEVGGGGSSNTNPGYNVTKQTVTLFNDTIETQEVHETYEGVVENIDFDLVAGETYTVVFDGTSYDIKAISANNNVILGELNDGNPSFDTYPFFIYNGTYDGINELGLITIIEGSYTVVIKHEEETVTTTPEFKSAVDSVTGYSIDKENETLYEGTAETIDNNGYIYGIITPTITLVEGDTYKVTFNGIEYTCKCFNSDGDPAIGAPFDSEEEIYDWSIYPFNIVTYPLGGGQYETSLSTNQEGSYTLKIEHLIVPTKTTPKFVSMIQGIAGIGSEKVVTLKNWSYNTNGGESVLTDIEGNKFYEGQDFTIEYNTGVSSNNPFDRIKAIVVRGNYQCDKIIIIAYNGVKYIKIPVCIFANSGGSNYAVFGSSNENLIGISIYE